MLQYLSSITSEKFKPSFDYDVCSRPVYTSVDWLRCTNPNHESFEAFIKKFMPLFKGVGFDFYDTGRGMNGYTNSWAISHDGQVCGHICADALNKMGGMFELSGMGCQILQIKWRLWSYMIAGLSQFGFRIKRLDVALDLNGALWGVYDSNMVDISHRVKGGLLRVGTGRGAKPQVTLVGDWLQVVTDKLGSDEYCPLVHAPMGLTINSGSSKSVNSWCIYEKGKQLASKDAHIDLASVAQWVRFERRFSTGSGRSEVVIPFDFAVMPDEALVYNCPGMKEYLQDWIDFNNNNGTKMPYVDESDIDLDRVGLLKSLAFKRTALHVARQSARFFRSLKNCGVNPLDFVNLIIHNENSRSFNPDIYEGYSVSVGDDLMSYLGKYYENRMCNDC